LLLVSHPRARRYLLRLRPDGVARVTIPRGGSQTEARRFAERNRAWLETQFQKLQAQPRHPVSWQPGSEIWFRGEQIRLEQIDSGQIRFGGETLNLIEPAVDLRPVVEKHLRRM